MTMVNADLIDDIWDEIISIINENTDITALVSDRVFDGEYIVLSTNQFPAISVQLLGEQPSSSRSRASGLDNIQYAFRIRAYTRILDVRGSMRQAKDLCSTIRGQLEQNLHLTLHNKVWKGEWVDTKYGELEFGEKEKNIANIGDVIFVYHAFVPRSTP